MVVKCLFMPIQVPSPNQILVRQVLFFFFFLKEVFRDIYLKHSARIQDGTLKGNQVQGISRSRSPTHNEPTSILKFSQSGLLNIQKGKREEYKQKLKKQLSKTI